MTTACGCHYQFHSSRFAPHQNRGRPRPIVGFVIPPKVLALADDVIE